MKKIFVFFFLSLLALLSKLPAAPINLVWQTDRSKAWEEDWLQELLSGLDVCVVDDNNYQKFLNNSIIVVSSLNLQGAEKYLKKLDKLKYNYGIILLSDERYIVPKEFYKYGRFIFRNYWHRKFVGQEKISIFPLGYKTGFWETSSPQLALSNQREYTWSFAGQISKKPTREVMVSCMKVFPHFYIHETFAWADPNSLTVLEYRDLLLNSVFVPCPAGWVNLDSFRLYEALECGCIPIVEKSPIDYFANYLGNHPFLAVDSWDQVPGLMNALLADPVLLEQRRLQCYDWWQKHKKEMNQKFLNIIKNTLN